MDIVELCTQFTEWNPSWLQTLNAQVYYVPVTVGGMLSKPMDQTLYFFTSVFCLLCSFYLKTLKDERSKKLFSIVTGTLANFYCFGRLSLFSAFQNILCYAMMVGMPANVQHLAVFVTSAFTLGAAQLAKQLYNPGENGLDLTMALMFNFCKVTSLTICVRDGLVIKQKGVENSRLKKREIAYAHTGEVPSFFDYWSYMYFCGASISGPFYEFKDFQMYMKSEAHYAKIPSTLAPTLMRVVNLVCFIFF